MRVLATIAASLVLLADCRAQQPPSRSASIGETCVVRRVVDGDTFHCADGLKVRLIGIDTPERGQGEAARRASAALRRLVPPGSRVRLETDVQVTDRYGRRLAYAWRDTLLVNEALVREGWALLYTVPPNLRYADRLQAAQRRAREARTGLWATGGFACTPRDFRARRCR
ncbi:MAG TPA: thermonuclease family protein [Gemmatimonadales bacterium]|nr:thermonuclease family protein [Gemmatimonadales bacterium]